MYIIELKTAVIFNSLMYIREGREGGGHNPISHQKFFQNPSPSWIFIKNPSRSYQNPSE